MKTTGSNCYSAIASRRLKWLWVLTILACGCNSEPSEVPVTHPDAISKEQWLRSNYEIVGREVKEFDDHSGTYIVLTIKHGKRKIIAECGATWTTETGEDLPSTARLQDNCHDLPMGRVTMERTGWDYLYWFSSSGKHREEISLIVKKVDIQ
ncbi:MAG TPA: hypothetical protein VFB76_04630 [Candidatus Angelobacter sp.]|nr:hypothetical protein [Candidatus Angelobacter sp.]